MSGVDWVYPPDAAERYPEQEPPICLRGGGDNWSVVRSYRIAAENPIPTEIIVFSGLSFAEARQRAEAMERYIRGNLNRPPPTWPDHGAE